MRSGTARVRAAAAGVGAPGGGGGGPAPPAPPPTTLNGLYPPSGAEIDPYPRCGAPIGE
jgi:hypothetical protein